MLYHCSRSARAQCHEPSSKTYFRSYFLNGDSLLFSKDSKLQTVDGFVIYVKGHREGERNRLPDSIRLSL